MGVDFMFDVVVPGRALAVGTMQAPGAGVAPKAALQAPTPPAESVQGHTDEDAPPPPLHLPVAAWPDQALHTQHLFPVLKRLGEA